MSPDADAVTGVPLVPVHGRVRARLATGGPVPGPHVEAELELPASEPEPLADGEPGHVVDTILAVAPLAVLPIVTFVLSLLAWGDWATSVLGAFAILAAQVARRLSGKAWFGFGHGFLGYRPDDGWPRGIQEDDDFTWSWPAGEDPAAPGEAAEPGRWSRGLRDVTTRSAWRPLH